MSLWILFAIVCAAGAVGGVVNALLTDNGFILPRPETTDIGRIMRPGFLGNILLGAIAAGISWGLYGPFAAALLFQFPSASAPPPPVGLSVSAFVGAVLVGIGGAKWLTNEVDKKLLRAAASQAVARQPNPAAAIQIATADPAEILRITRS